MTPLPDAAALTPAEVAALCGVCLSAATRWMTQGRWDGCTLASRKPARGSPRTTTAGDLRRFLKETRRPVPDALRRRPAA